MIWVLAAAILLAFNVGYCASKILEDIAARRFSVAALGAVCLVGINALIVWMFYASIMGSSDL